MLNLPKPFDEREVRDSECLVYEAIESQPVMADFFASPLRQRCFAAALSYQGLCP